MVKKIAAIDVRVGDIVEGRGKVKHITWVEEFVEIDFEDGKTLTTEWFDEVQVDIDAE